MAPGDPVKPPVVAVVGLSNSGKTLVATALIQRLVAQGYRIAAVKHSPHGHQVDRPGTDSERLFRAGAAKVIVSSPDQRTSIERTKQDLSLEEIVASLGPGYDLVVAEGFKGSTAPHVLVLGTDRISPLPQHIIAVVSDQQSVEDTPHYSFQEMDKLAQQIKAKVLNVTT